MTAIVFRSFGGISPAIDPRYLPEHAAQTALNAKVFRAIGPLDAQRDVSASVWAFTKSGAITSLYRFGDTPSDTQFWFHWAADVDAVRGFIAGDTSIRTFYTGDGIPKATDNALAITGGGDQYPNASYMLGLPVPTVAPIVTNNDGLPEEGELRETRVYTYCWVNSWDEPSAPYAADPMPAGTQVDLSVGQAVKIVLPTPPTGPHNINRKRIYRSQTGSGGQITYLFVAEIPATTDEYIDTIPSEELAEDLPSLTWQPPPEGLKGLVAMANGILAGFEGHDIYLSAPFLPFAWPRQYHQSTGYPVVGLGTLDTTLAILTTAKPYFLQGGHPDSMTLVESDIEQACIAKRSIVSMGGSVIYASPDGLVRLSPGGSGLVTQNLFEPEQWRAAFKPESIHAYSHDGLYIGFYDKGDGTKGGFIMDLGTGNFTLHGVHAIGGYADPLTDTLYLSLDGQVVKWDGGAKLPYTWRSKKLTLPQPVGFTCLRVEAETYPVTCEVYRDGASIQTYTLASGAVRRLPPGKGRTWELEIRGTPRVYSAGIAESPMELAGA